MARMLEDRTARASIMNLPFRIQAQRAGLKLIAEATDEIGPYMSTAGFVIRPWAERNGDTLIRYIRAYVRGLRWALAPENRDSAVALLAERLRLPADIAAEGFAIAIAPGGLAADAAIDRSEEHTSELQSLMRNSYAVFCLKK